MDYETLRKHMVEEQIISRGIIDPNVIKAFLKVERHKFIPEKFNKSAYGDFPLPIGDGQTISQPYMVALMTDSLSLTGQEKVLEIGTGSGYQAAILAELAGEVYTIERFDNLVKGAKAIIGELGYKNINIKLGDGTLGWPEESPFDRIIVTAAALKVPMPLIEQLANNGKLLIPLGESFTQILTLIEKKQEGISTTEICGCVFVPLIGKYGWKDV